MSITARISIVILLALTPVSFFAQDASNVSRDEARKKIQQANIEWGKARIALDKQTFEKMMDPGPDFYVLLSGGRRLTRQQFLDRISAFPPGVTLVRFDASVLTVEAIGDHWVALIEEKLEFERKTPDGKVERNYNLSITRDGWRKLNNDKWVALFSEQLGQEFWRGSAPPIPNW